MSPDERDDLDRALAAGLGALAPDAGAVDATLESMRPQMQRARTRHRVVRASSALAALLLLGGAAAFAAPRTVSRSHVAVSSPTGRDGNGSRHPQPRTTTSVAHVRVNEHASTTTLAPDRTATTTVPLPRVVSPPPSIPAPGGNRGSGRDRAGPGNDGSGSEPTTTSSPPTTVPSGNQTFNSAGGSLTVAFDGAALTLISDPPASGYTAAIKSKRSDDIEVEFRKGEWTWTIAVQVDNGRLTHQIFSDD